MRAASAGLLAAVLLVSYASVDGVLLESEDYIELGDATSVLAAHNERLKQGIAQLQDSKNLSPAMKAEHVKRGKSMSNVEMLEMREEDKDISNFKGKDACGCEEGKTGWSRRRRPTGCSKTSMSPKCGCAKGSTTNMLEAAACLYPGAKLDAVAAVAAKAAVVTVKKAQAKKAQVKKSGKPRSQELKAKKRAKRKAKKRKARGGRKRKSARGGRKRRAARGGRKRKVTRGGRKRKAARGGMKRKAARGGRKRKSARRGRRPTAARPAARGGRKRKSARRGRTKKIGRITVQVLRKKAIPMGQTCVFKAPVKHKSVQREKDLTKLYNNCKKLVAGAPAFVVYPANSKEAQSKLSNCWKCSSAKLRKSKMTKMTKMSKMTAAFVFVKVGGMATRRRAARGRFSRRKRRFRRI